MVDIEAFVKSMKLTWLKRMLTSKAEWSHIAQKELPDIHSLVCYGSEKLQSINGNIANEFWKDVITAFIDFSKVFSPTYPAILCEYIWFSDYTKYKRSIVKNWDEKGIRFIADLVNVNTGKLHSKESLEESYGVKMTVLCYRSLLKSLPETVKSEVTAKSAGPVIPLRMNLIQNHAKFPRLACSRK